jgi:predicted ATP-dependent endonuclease of OLD family
VRYKSFEIIRYRAINKKLSIEFNDKNEIIPIIGINECGKTTILKSIMAFDYYNDEQNDGEHISQVDNLYMPRPEYTSQPAQIKANIILEKDKDKENLEGIIRNCCINKPNCNEEIVDMITNNIPETISITRNFSNDGRYTIDNECFSYLDEMVQNEISMGMITYLPLIIHFDDFNDKFPDKIDVPQKEEDIKGWSQIMDVLFKRVSYSLISFGTQKNENLRASMNSDVEKILNDTIASNWKGLILNEKVDNLKFKIEFFKEDPTKGASYLKIKVSEGIDGRERIFDIGQRSKGFNWFFNFVMKTSFNPKNIYDPNAAIFLLDEPGAYLHISAQTELCKKLTELTKDNNIVIYCTHSQYLLDPDYVKLPSIKICSKETDGNIKLLSIYEYAKSSGSTTLALEPVYRALEVKDFYGADLKSNVILVEGITDFYSFKMFNDLDNNANISFVPFTGVKNINRFVPILLGLLGGSRKFFCLYDGDDAGEKAKCELREYFGEDIEKIAFTLKDLNDKFGKIETLYDENELCSYKAEKEQQKESSDNVSDNVKKNDIKNIIMSLFFIEKSDRDKILLSKFSKTKHNFNRILKILQDKFDNYPV